MIRIRRGRAQKWDAPTLKLFVHIHQNRVERGFNALERADKIAEGMQITRLPQNFARLYMYCDDHAEAEAHSRRGIALCEEGGNRVVLPYMHEILGNALAERGAKAEAEQVFQNGIAMAHADGDLRAKCQLHLRMGHLLLHARRYEEAREALDYCVNIARVLGYQLVEARAQRELAEVYEATAQTAAALKAMKIADKIESNRRIS